MLLATFSQGFSFYMFLIKMLYLRNDTGNSLIYCFQQNFQLSH